MEIRPARREKIRLHGNLTPGMLIDLKGGQGAIKVEMMDHNQHTGDSQPDTEGFTVSPRIREQRENCSTRQKERN